MRVITLKNVSLQFDDSSLLSAPFSEEELLSYVQEHLEILNVNFQRVIYCPQILVDNIQLSDLEVEDLFEESDSGNYDLHIYDRETE